jgi:tRNA pseudouridine55 synthase
MTLTPERNYKSPPEGILNISKPSGISSFSVVSRVRRILGGIKCGHAGTLDPLARGVLLVATGRTTRLVPYLPGGLKLYRGEITLGAATTTDDAEGEIVSRQEVPELSRERIESVLSQYIGRIEQRPPAFSAVKVSGKRSYKKARAGHLEPPPARNVYIENIKLLEYRDNKLTVEVACGPGTYIRSLARDVGRDLGTCGYLSDLLRLAEGEFTLQKAISLEDLPQAIEKDLGGCPWFTPLDAALPWLAEITLDDRLLERLTNGNTVQVAESIEVGQSIRVRGKDGSLYALAIAEDKSVLTPRVVLRKAEKRNGPGENLSPQL